VTQPRYYRGGPSLAPRRLDVKFDRATGLVLPERGVSVSTRPDGLDRFGGAYEVGPLPPGLVVIQWGADPHHHEIIPATAMTFSEYADLLKQVPLTPV
jgi:acetoin utilization deacetylase AcuC-like enzyme